jgi:hypothetical protein
MVAFYMDVHIPRSITVGLRLRDVDVLTAQEDHHAEVDDPVLLDRTTALKRVLFSQDEDLLVEAQKRQLANLHLAGIVYIHQLKMNVGQCVLDLELLAKAANDAELANIVTYLPL